MKRKQTRYQQQYSEPLPERGPGKNNTVYKYLMILNDQKINPAVLYQSLLPVHIWWTNVDVFDWSMKPYGRLWISTRGVLKNFKLE